jgi:hypothetical protein
MATAQSSPSDRIRLGVSSCLLHHVRRFGVGYLADQVCLNPHPKELMTFVGPRRRSQTPPRRSGHRPFDLVRDHLAVHKESPMPVGCERIVGSVFGCLITMEK